MMKSSNVVRIMTLASILIIANPAMAGGLDSFLDEVEIRASGNLGSFKTDLAVAFGVSEGTVNGIFEVVSRPSDVYMCLRIGEIANLPINRVIDEYRMHRGQGWGVIAKNLGIKPGSDEFHALKKGRLPVHTAGCSSKNKNKGGKKHK